MEQQHEPDLVFDTAYSASVLLPKSPIKYDNRAYLVAAYAGWADASNRPITGTVEVEEQIVPDAYAAGYRTMLG